MMREYELTYISVVDGNGLQSYLKPFFLLKTLEGCVSAMRSKLTQSGA